MSFFSSFFKKEISVLGIDIGSSAVKLVQIRRKHGKAVLQTYGELALGPYAGLEVGQATALQSSKVVEVIRDVLRESKTTTTFCGVALPFSASLIAFISIPPVPDSKVGDVVSLEARKYIPVPLSEVLLDYSIIPREESYVSEDENAKKDKLNKDVLVVAIHNDFINEYQSIMN